MAPAIIYWGEELGLKLFEMRYDAAARQEYDTPPVESKAFGLHAKVIIVDRRFVYVGSLNLDPALHIP
jgi:putative cardiolipin synthase